MRPAGRALLIGAALAAAVSIGAMSFLERLIFQPGMGAAREDADFAAEELFLETSDGVRVHAYWLDAGPGVDRALLFLHGNAGDASGRLAGADRLRSLGSHVLLLDYRGYGRSEGRPSESGVYLDARAALDHLVKTRDVPMDRIVVFGRSLGGAVAVDVAQGQPLAGLVVESSFPSIAAIARSYLGVGLDGWLSTKFASETKASAVRCPVLVIHGSRDRVIRAELGRRLYEVMPEPKTWFEVRGGRHNDTPHVGGDAYWAAWQEFLDRVAPLDRAGLELAP